MEGRPIKEIEDYYKALWGAPVDVTAYYALGHEIRVLKWDAKSTDEGVALYLTSGASSVVHGSHRVEFVIGLSPEFDAVSSSLAALATFPLSAGPIGKGETVTLACPALPGGDRYTYLIIPRVDDFVPPLKMKDGSHTEILPVLPIYEAELKLKRAHGSAWLMQRLNDQRLRISDPFRRPMQDL